MQKGVDAPVGARRLRQARFGDLDGRAVRREKAKEAKDARGKRVARHVALKEIADGRKVFEGF